MGMIGNTQKPKDPSGMSKSDKIAIFGAMLRDIGANLNGGDASNLATLSKSMTERREQLARMAAQQQWAGAFGPQTEVNPLPDVSVGRQPQVAPGPSPVDQVNMGQPPQMGAATPSQRLYEPMKPPVSITPGIGGGGAGLRDPRLMQHIIGAPEGAPVREILQLLTAQQPDTGFTPTGFGYDKKSGDMIGRFQPQLDKGQKPLFDERGNIAGIKNMDGSVQSAADMAGAVERAKSGAQAAYDLVDVPQQDGTTRKMPRLQAVQALSRQGEGSGFGVTRAPEVGAAAVTAAQATAQAAADRASAAQGRVDTAPTQLAALDEMEKLLPDVISGFGADARIQANRAMALAGNEDAKRRVASTETFINQGRVLVASIIKTFGANPTEGERKFAERMSGADAELNPETLKEGIRLQRERIARDQRAGAPRSGPATSGQGYSVKAVRRMQ